MLQITKIFKRSKVLIPFIAAGDPNLSTTEKLVYEFEKAGADIIELGIPFSDPIADGPVIQEAFNRALKKNISIPDCLGLVKQIRKNSRIPLVFMASYSLIFKYGIDKFVKESKNAGVDGIIPPDLTPDSAKDFIKACRKYKMDTIFLVAPTSTDERIKLAAKYSTGFIYAVSVTGITGVRKEVSKDLSGFIKRIRKFTNKPIAVGFGISTPEQARTVSKIADGVIVGSVIVDLITKRKFRTAANLVSTLKKAINLVL